MTSEDDFSHISVPLRHISTRFDQNTSKKIGPKIWHFSTRNFCQKWPLSGKYEKPLYPPYYTKLLFLDPFLTFFQKISAFFDLFLPKSHFNTGFIHFGPHFLAIFTLFLSPILITFFTHFLMIFYYYK